MRKTLLLLALLLLLSSCSQPRYDGHYDSIRLLSFKDKELTLHRFEARGFIYRSVFRGNEPRLSTQGLTLMDQEVLTSDVPSYILLDKLFHKVLPTLPSDSEDKENAEELHALQVEKEGVETLYLYDPHKEEPQELKNLFQEFQRILEEAKKPKG